MSTLERRLAEGTKNRAVWGDENSLLATWPTDAPMFSERTCALSDYDGTSTPAAALAPPYMPRRVPLADYVILEELKERRLEKHQPHVRLFGERGKKALEYAAVLIERGWCQDAFGICDGGAVQSPHTAQDLPLERITHMCAHTALSRAATMFGVAPPDLVRAFEDRVESHICFWNNRPDQTAEKIAATMRSFAA